jgi:hypothetical protein
MSIADEFTFGLLVDVTEAKLPTDARVALLWEHYVERKTETWEQRFRSWQDLHGISMSTFPRYHPLWGYIEARNAIVHGLGALTGRQMKKPPRTKGRLTAASIGLIGSRLVLTVDHATECALVVRALIEWLDEEAAVT